MKVLNLRCSHEHAFEGWFASDADYESQLERKLVECPMCGDAAIVRMPTAPRLNVSNLKERDGGRSTQGDTRREHDAPRQAAGHAAERRGSARPASDTAASSSGAMTVPTARDLFDPRSPEHARALAQAQGEAMAALRQVIEKTEDVGDQFAEEARRMHYGEADQRDIRGVASMDDAVALREEGIEVMALPMPPSLKGRLQ